MGVCPAFLKWEKNKLCASRECDLSSGLHLPHWAHRGCYPRPYVGWEVGVPSLMSTCTEPKRGHDKYKSAVLPNRHRSNVAMMRPTVAVGSILKPGGRDDDPIQTEAVISDGPCAGTCPASATSLLSSPPKPPAKSPPRLSAMFSATVAKRKVFHWEE